MRKPSSHGTDAQGWIKTTSLKEKNSTNTFWTELHFLQMYPSKLHAASLICCGYSINHSAFYNSCVCWYFSERALGFAAWGWCYVGCVMWKPAPCLVTVAHLTAKEGHSPSSWWYLLCNGGRWRPGYKPSSDDVYWLCTVHQLQGACGQDAHHWNSVWAGNLAPHPWLWFERT